MTAHEIVEKLLTRPIQEAGGYMVVFGPDTPANGYLFTGEDPVAEFIHAEHINAGFEELKPGAAPDDDDKRVRMLYHYADYGYKFFIQDNDRIKVYSKLNIALDKVGLGRLEQVMGLTPDTQIEWVNAGQNGTASSLLYGKKDTEADTEREQEIQKNDSVQVMTFGGLQQARGSYHITNSPDEQKIEAGIKNGYAYVLKYANGSFNVVVPERWTFTREARHSLETRFGMNRNTQVSLYVGDTSLQNKVVTTANECIYR